MDLIRFYGGVILVYALDYIWIQVM